MENNTEPETVEEDQYKPTCPDCGSENLLIVGHCITCMECGYSLCSN